MDRRVYGALAAAPVIAAGCYALYQYTSNKNLYVNLNTPESDDRAFLSGIFTKARNVLYRNTLHDRLWNYIESRSEEGNADSVLATFDDYCYNYEWSWAIGDKKAALLTKVVQEAAPMVALECGTFCGYSAVVIALNMPSDGRLITIEASPKSAEIAKRIIDRAGFGEKVTVVNGHTCDVIPELRSKYNIETLDLIFLDHFKSQYVADMQKLERGGYLHTGTTVFANNIIGEGSEGFSLYVRNSGNYECKFFESDMEYMEGLGDGMERAIYVGADMYTGDTLGLS